MKEKFGRLSQSRGCESPEAWGPHPPKANDLAWGLASARRRPGGASRSRPGDPLWRRYTEALTRAADTDGDAAFQRFHDALAENFSPEEILEIVAVVVNMNGLDPDQACRGRDAGPGLSSAAATKPAAARTPPRAGHLSKIRMGRSYLRRDT
jgi:hypothetical protein